MLSILIYGNFIHFPFDLIKKNDIFGSFALKKPLVEKKRHLGDIRLCHVNEYYMIQDVLFKVPEFMRVG